MPNSDCAYVGRHRKCEHLNAVEVALTDECENGCKVMECNCGDRIVSHREIYGCHLAAA